MSFQECALYGELVVHLRDRAAELLARERGDADSERARLDGIIRDWFFTGQEELHGCSPRDLIWAEQKGEPNPIDAEWLDGFFMDDCPICQAENQEIKAAIEAGEDPSWQWYHDDGGYPLIAYYDPEGWQQRWAEEDDALEHGQAEQAEPEEEPPYVAPAYEPPPLQVDGVSPHEFIARLRRPWLDPALDQAARALAARVDCPQPTVSGLHYRRLTYDEAVSLAVGLYDQGVDVEELLAQIEGFPYENVALEWLSYPEQNAALVIEAMEEEIAPHNEHELARFRHHRDFMFALAWVIHPGARLWLHGWLDAVAHGVFARAADLAPEE